MYTQLKGHRNKNTTSFVSISIPERSTDNQTYVSDHTIVLGNTYDFGSKSNVWYLQRKNQIYAELKIAVTLIDQPEKDYQLVIEKEVAAD